MLLLCILKTDFGRTYDGILFTICPLLDSAIGPRTGLRPYPTDWMVPVLWGPGPLLPNNQSVLTVDPLLDVDLIRCATMFNGDSFSRFCPIRRVRYAFIWVLTRPYFIKLP